MTNYVSTLAAWVRRVPGQRGFPLALALAAVILMLPALGAGFLLDDFVQRVVQFRPADLPPHISDTGFVSSDSGKLSTVLCDLFGFPRGEEAAARARDYGILAWWMPEGLRAAVWRPFTALTHWLDYRLFPKTPALMHAHNIAWYAVAIFLAATLYRKLGTCSSGGELEQKSSASLLPLNMPSSACIAGLAAVLFLLDKNTYFPVMFVANRGFVISLVFGLLCLHAHHRWRTTKSSFPMWLSALWLLLSLLANEGGASTLALLVAYALVLEPGGWRACLTSLLPAAVVVLGWRSVYVSSAFGVRLLGGYIDPGYEPFLFLKNLPSRANALLGGQLAGLPPEMTILLSPTWQTVLTLFFAGFNLLCAAVFLPVLRRDPVPRFWAIAMLLALVPAATVVPLSKNMGFVAVGAFGVIASFLGRFAVRQDRGVMWGPLRPIAWCIAGWLVVAHLPGALAGRVLVARANSTIPKAMARWCDFNGAPEIGGRDVVVVNNPPQLSTLAVPFYRAYHGRPLPKTIRILIPGSIRFAVTRADPATLILTAKEADLFDCPALGPMHMAYLFKAMNDFLAGDRTWKTGDRVTRKGFVAEVLDVSQRGAPRSVAFHFDSPLESKGIVWLFFDWRSYRYAPFVPPRVGDTIEIPGPGR